MKNTKLSVEIMLVEDNPGDIRLITELFKESDIENQVNVACDGEQALMMLHKEGKFTTMRLPDLILLDLNLPKINGKEVLRQIKTDNRLMYIPVIILTTSQEEKDIIETYNYCANSFITKPVDLDSFIKIIKSIQEFWLNIVKLPKVNQMENLMM
ncbi:MAG TPA: response regulator [Methanobacterium sp.]|nr:response regulator [Methanobacterium sp.]